MFFYRPLPPHPIATSHPELNNRQASTASPTLYPRLVPTSPNKYKMRSCTLEKTLPMALFLAQRLVSNSEYQRPSHSHSHSSQSQSQSRALPGASIVLALVPLHYPECPNLPQEALSSSWGMTSWNGRQPRKLTSWRQSMCFTNATLVV